MRLFSRKQEKRDRSVELRFHEPVTYDLLEKAAIALGIDPDLAMTDPQEALSGTDRITIEQGQAFLDVVLVKRVNLRRMPLQEAQAVILSAAAGPSGFFTHLYMQRFAGLIEASALSMRAVVPRPRKAAA